MEEAVVSAAYRIAEAENKSFVAAESVKEAERVSTMAEEMESLLQFAMDCFDQSTLENSSFFSSTHSVISSLFHSSCGIMIHLTFAFSSHWQVQVVKFC